MHRAAGEHDAVPEAWNRKFRDWRDWRDPISLSDGGFNWWVSQHKIPKSSIETTWPAPWIDWTEAPDRICTAPRRKGRFLGGSAAYGGALAESQGANLSFDSVHHSKINTYIHRKVYIYKDPNNTQRSCAPFTIHISTASLHLFSDFSVFFSLFSCKHQGLCEESLRRLPCPDHLILRCRVVVFSFYHLGGSGEKLHGGWSIQAIWGGSMNEKKPALRVFYGYFMNIWYSRCFMDILWIFVDNCTYFFQNDWPFQNVGSIGRWLFIRCFQICLGYHDWFRYRDFLEIFIFRASKHMLMTRHEDFNASTPGKEGLEDRDEVSEPNASMRDMIMQQRYLSIQYQLKTPKTYHIITPSCDYTSSHQASFCYIFP